MISSRVLFLSLLGPLAAGCLMNVQAIPAATHPVHGCCSLHLIFLILQPSQARFATFRPDIPKQTLHVRSSRCSTVRRCHLLWLRARHRGCGAEICKGGGIMKSLLTGPGEWPLSNHCDGNSHSSPLLAMCNCFGNRNLKVLHQRALQPQTSRRLDASKLGRCHVTNGGE